MTFRALFLALGLILIGQSAVAQAQVAFGGLQHDSSLPLEMAADQLAIDQATGVATMSGNVVIGQGTLRISAAKMVVEYQSEGENAGDVRQLRATGGVTFTNGAEAAEAKEAVYTIGTSQLVLAGDVVLTQGNNALAGEKLTVDLNTGAGVMEGRVRTVFRQGDN